MSAAAPCGLARRVLREALVVAQAGEPPPIAEQQVHAAKSGTGIRSYLSVSMVGETSYLNGAWVD